MIRHTIKHRVEHYLDDINGKSSRYEPSHCPHMNVEKIFSRKGIDS